MTWHVSTESLASYARGAIDEASAYSLEQHLLECAACRERVAGLVDERRLARVWDGVDELVHAPGRGPVERVLVRFGVSDALARLLAATPSLTLSWLGAVALALGFSVVAAYGSERGWLIFLALAPLLPLAGVAAAYGPWLDPVYELSLASPLGSFRLLLVRTVAVLATTTVLAGAASLALPQLDWRMGAWLLPALGITALSLALASAFPLLWAAGGLGFLWISLVSLTATASDDRYVAFRAPTQVFFAALTLVAVLVVVLRRERYEMSRAV